MIDWKDPALVARLTKFAGTGLSASAIAKKLGGPPFTKGSVVGACHRHGIALVRKTGTVEAHHVRRPVPAAPTPARGPRPIHELREGECRWPLGKLLDPPKLFCGKATAGARYCAEHTLLSTRRAA